MSTGKWTDKNGNSYFMFVGPLNQEKVQLVAKNLTSALHAHADLKHVHLAIHSEGGRVVDGIFLHNFFAGFPVNPTVYNFGLVASIAAVAFIGAKNRRASRFCSFMTHEVIIKVEGEATSGELVGFSKQARIDEVQVERMLRENITLPDASWEMRKAGELWLDAEEAKKVGFVQEIEDFAPPAGVAPYAIY